MGQYSKAIRKLKFNNTEKECYICNKYGDISELHHLVEVSDISKSMQAIQYDWQLDELVKGVWLCPNHHTIFHKLSLRKRTATLMNLSDEEIEKYNILYNYSIELYTKLLKIISNADLKEEIKFNIKNEIMKKTHKLKIATYNLKITK